MPELLTRGDGFLACRSDRLQIVTSGRHRRNPQNGPGIGEIRMRHNLRHIHAPTPNQSESILASLSPSQSSTLIRGKQKRSVCWFTKPA